RSCAMFCFFVICYKITLRSFPRPVNQAASRLAEASMDHGQHDHRRCIADALDAAERVCAGRGARLTELRRRVLELVWQSHRPVGAYPLLAALGRDGHAPAPPTVYRALDFLQAQGLVHRIESRNAYVGCPHPETDHTGQLM